MCAFGWTVANGATNFYWASDLLHRILHIPKMAEGTVEHFAGEYDEVLEQAKMNPAQSVRDSDTLQMFALEVYAHDIALPGEGCAGTFKASSSAAASASGSSSAAAVASSASVTPSPTAGQAATTTSTAGKVR
jgi:hypothetical protein